jgi:Fe-S oxidoreductase/nitrate reductase gamma subunit
MYIEHFLYVTDIEILVYLSLLLGIPIFLYGIWRSYKRWTYGGEKIELDNIGLRLKRLLKYGLLQYKVLYKSYEGIMHLLIYIGFIILFIGTILRALEYDFTMKILGYKFITSNTFLLYKLLLNIGGLLAIVGIILALIRRLFLKSRYLIDEAEDYIILLCLLFILITGFILDGISTYGYRLEWINNYDFIGYTLANILAGYGDLIVIYRIIWVSHMLLAIFTFAYIPYTKLFHILAGGLLNTFFSRLEEPAAFKAIPNLDEIVESGELPGVGTLKMTSWKERLDYDACIKCARCTENCPATLSEKPLSPMNLMIEMRRIMDMEKYDDELVPRYIDDNIIWSCVTCGACVYQCPMLIHHVETILDIRRYLFNKGENTPEEATELSYNIMRYNNPLGIDPGEREKFIKELVEEVGDIVAKEGEEYEYIYWLGCQTTYDPVNKEIAKKLLSTLTKIGIKVAILPDENCCGEPARRVGDELLFRELLEKNINILSRYNFKKLLVNCPHGYNVFKNEYPLYGFNVDVEHHTRLLYNLLKGERIKIRKDEIEENITYHDPCYLGRWNGIFDEPRIILKEIYDDRLREIKRGREKSFCCGGGGGHAFFEIKIGDRISKLRMDEIISSGANLVCVACPFCKIMLNSEAPEEVKVMDIIEIIHEHIE